MKLLSSAVLMFVVLAFAACAPAAEEVVVEEPDTTAADIAAIQALVEAWSTTYDLEDPEPYMALYAEDAELWANWGPILHGRDAIRSWVVENFIEGSMTSSSKEREVIGGVAYDFGTFELATVPGEGEEARTIYGKYVLVMHRQADGSWKVARYMWNNTPPPGE
jgi:uncharacterized protein (TIGR02246 family)